MADQGQSPEPPSDSNIIYALGWRQFHDGIQFRANPYPRFIWLHDQWAMGWLEASLADRGVTEGLGRE